MEIDEQLQDLATDIDLPALERALVARLGDDLTRIRTVYRRDPDGSTFAMVVRWPFGTLKPGHLYQLFIEITTPVVEGRPIWPFTLEEEVDLLEGNDSWEVERIMLNPPRRGVKTGLCRTSTVTLCRVPFRRYVSGSSHFR